MHSTMSRRRDESHQLSNIVITWLRDTVRLPVFTCVYPYDTCHNTSSVTAYKSVIIELVPRFQVQVADSDGTEDEIPATEQVTVIRVY